MLSKETEQALRAAVVRILDRGLAVVGTGSLVEAKLVATCAHVVDKAVKDKDRAEPSDPRGETVEVEFVVGTESIRTTAAVEPDYYRKPCAGDVAVLRLREHAPPGVKPLVLAASTNLNGRSLRGFSFPKREGLWLTATGVGLLRPDKLQVSSTNISPGSSGAPLWDARGHMVAMASAIKDQEPETGRHFDTAYVIPAEVLVGVCPELSLIGPADIDDPDLEAPLSKDELITTMARRLEDSIPERVKLTLARKQLVRPIADRRLHLFLRRKESSVILTTAVAGAGKSTWSARHAKSQAAAQPVLWSPAHALHLTEPDPVSLLAVQASYGTANVGRVAELVGILRRERVRLIVVLDAIDEVYDFGALIGALREFGMSALAPLTDLLLTCREEALVSLEGALSAWRSDLLNEREGTLIRLDTLRDHERKDFLISEGATEEEARRVAGLLPDEFAGIPLFLRHALALAKGSTEPVEGGIIEAFAKFAIDDVHKRLHRGGKGPSTIWIKRVITELALRAIASRTESVDLDIAQEVLGQAGVDGEDTLLGRAIHVGILEARGEGGIGFGHALYLEFFAALAAATKWPVALPTLTSEVGKQIARRFARFLPDSTWLVRELLPVDAIAACDCAVHTNPISADLAAELVNAVKASLGSRFRSDRIRALRVLANIPGNAAREAAVAWWNGLTREERVSFSFEAAELFLQLEELGAFDLILGHRYFSPEFPWYEPSFVSRLKKSGDKFRKGLIARAHEELARGEINEHRVQRLISLLAILGDTKFIGYLRQRAEGGGMLSQAELRALIHANTENAVEVYAEAIENAIAIPLSDEVGDTDKDRREQRHYRRDALVVRTTDVRMFPHDAFLELVNAALSSRHRAHVSFGLTAAELLASPLLIAAEAGARRRHRGGRLDVLGSRLIPAILRESSFERMSDLYLAHEDDYVREELIKHAYEVPGLQTERFLVRCIERGEHVFYAVQSLGSLRAVIAGPAILGVYETSPSAHLRDICVRALGRIGYQPAAGVFSSALLRAVVEPLAPESEYDLVDALGSIGGETARGALVSAFPRAHYRAHLLRALFGMRDAVATHAASDLAHRHAVGVGILAEALGSLAMDEQGTSRQVQRDLKDEKLLLTLLSEVDGVLAQVQGPRIDLREVYIIRAIARFDRPEATEYLNRLAYSEESSAAHTARDILAGWGDERAIRAFIDERLSWYENPHQPVYGRDAERFAHWPRHLVREALLARIAKGGEGVGRWLFLLQWFAEDGDVALFEGFENAENAHVADIVHRFLRVGGVYAYRRRATNS